MSGKGGQADARRREAAEPAWPAGPADPMRLTTMLGEQDRADGAFVADRLIDAYERLGVRTSILLRGGLGYGPAHRLRSDRLLSISEDLPPQSTSAAESSKRRPRPKRRCTAAWC